MISFLLLFTGIFSQQSDPVGDAWDALKKTRLSHFELQQPFVNEQLRNPNWDFGRDAYTEVNKFIRLTNDVQSQDGWLWAKKNIGVTSWAIEFKFNIEHEGALSGDGFAFWATKDSKVTGPVFGNQDYFTGVGVLFDTYANSRVRHSYPWIMAMKGDGKTHYDHDFDGSSNELGGCHLEIRNRPAPTSCRITYLDGESFKVDLRLNDAATWKNCFNVNTSISPAYTFGFTAMTGGVTSKHDIISLAAFSVDHQSRTKPASQFNNYNNQQFNNFQNQNTQAKKDGSWGFFTYLFVLLSFGFIVYAVHVYVKTKEKQSYKRF